MENDSRERKIQVFQEKIEAMGCTPNQQQNRHRKLNFHQIVFVVVCAINITFLCFYMVLEANSIETYMDAIFSMTTLIAITISFISIVCKNDEIFISIDNCEKELNESKLRIFEIIFVF